MAKELLTAQVQKDTKKALKKISKKEKKTLSLKVDEVLTNFVKDQFDAR
jgi:mRNA-degrading endonuclease RelE of RelBE toxin-antitoxin system